MQDKRCPFSYSYLVDRDLETAESADAWLVAAGTPGNLCFGTALKDLRLRSGLSPQQLANRAQVHVSFVRGIERGVQAPSLAKAKALLACMADQDRIEWAENGPYDLRISDPAVGGSVDFLFKAEVHGQNRRKDVREAAPGLVAALEQLAHVLKWSQPKDAPDPLVGLSAGLQALGDSTGLVLHGMHDEPADGTVPAEAGDASSSMNERVGRIVRMLASADEKTLIEIEYLLVGPTHRPIE